MSTTWIVRFCENCFRAFDVPPKSRTVLCDECKRAWRRRYQAEYRRQHGRPERVIHNFATPEQRRERARKRKADWRARTGRH